MRKEEGERRNERIERRCGKLVSGGYYGGTIARTIGRAQTAEMAKYVALLGKRVRVEYRAGEVTLPAIGMLVADSGKSIFLEERFEKSESVKTFRWEIPYQCILKIAKLKAEPPASADADQRDVGAA